LTTGVTGTLPIANGGTGATTLAGASIATYTGTETLTNKTLTAPVISSLSSASATALTLQSAGTTAVTIDTSQNVGIGVTPTYKLDIAATSSIVARFARTSFATGYVVNAATETYFSADSSGNNGFGADATNGKLVFWANSAERMRIDSSGNLLVAKNATSTTTAGAEIRAADGSFYSTNSATTNATSTYNAYSTGASAYRFYVGMAGTVYATNTTITGISDVRLKENIRDLDDGLDVLMALRPRKFDWKEGKGAGIKNARGFIAQEFETVLPDMIEEWKDPAPEGEEPYKAVNANLIPTLVKAIQELKAINDQQAETINALTARVVALEAK